LIASIFWPARINLAISGSAWLFNGWFMGIPLVVKVPGIDANDINDKNQCRSSI
jgi:hypothetical protein